MKRRKAAYLSIVALAFGLFGALAYRSASAEDVRIRGACASRKTQPLEAFDHAPLDDLLRRYVDARGLVDYASWKSSAEDRRRLNRYLESAGCVDLDAPASRAARLTFWINLYNALTLEGILREYPTRSIRNHTGLVGYNIWKDLLVWVDDRYWSLLRIENDVLRRMDEPRIHFAIVCASLGCPKLRDEAYVADKLEAQLDANARDFFAEPTNFQADVASRSIRLSAILKWFAKDFGATKSAQLGTLAPYLPDEASRRLVLSENVRIKYSKYDWSINDRAKSQPARRSGENQ